MKKLGPALLVFLIACSHTQEENYTMIHKVVNELGMIKDSISLLDKAIAVNHPEAFINVDKDSSRGRRFRKFYADSLTNTADSSYGKMLTGYNRLQERFFTYQDIYSHIYKRLPKDSIILNSRIERNFQTVTQQ